VTHHLNRHNLIIDYRHNNHFGTLIGSEFVILEPGIVQYTIPIAKQHLATPKAVHGGLIAALLDATVGVGALSLVCEENQVVSTLSLQVSYLSGVCYGNLLQATSKVLKRGRRTIFMQAEVLNEHQTLVATCTATLNAYPAEKAGY
jgi:uncharacterized protein (TIGR00369 family)